LEQTLKSRVAGTGKQIGDPLDQLPGQILVEEQSHKATRRPSRAAYSYTALKSSFCNSG
jgi:hypothetical protein